MYADTTTSVVRRDDTSIASGKGIFKDVLGPSPLPCDVATIQNWGDQYLLRHACDQRKSAWEIFPQDTGLHPGMRVQLTDAALGITHVILVWDVTQKMVASQPDRVTTFTGIEYISDVS